jgi:hypothetical protein
MEVAKKLLELVDRHAPGIQQDRHHRVMQQMRIHSLGDPRGQRACFDDRLHGPYRVACVVVTLEEVSLPLSLKVRTQFLPQGGQDGHITVRLPLGACDMDLGRVAVEMQVLDLDMDELIDADPGLEQRLDHQSVLAACLVAALDEALDLGFLQPLHRAPARARRLLRTGGAAPAPRRTWSGRNRNGACARARRFPEPRRRGFLATACSRDDHAV